MELDLQNLFGLHVLTIIYIQKNSKVCSQLRIFQKEIKSTLNQELMHILGEVISKSDYNLKSGCT